MMQVFNLSWILSNLARRFTINSEWPELRKRERVCVCACLDLHGSAGVSILGIVSQGRKQVKLRGGDGAPVSGQAINSDATRNERGFEGDANIAQARIARGARVAMAAHERARNGQTHP